MEKRKWYDKDIETSLLGFGCMRFTTVDGKIDEEKALELIDIAYKNGVNYFDTANPYLDFQSEPFVGKALSRYDRNTFYLATKMSMWTFNTREEAEALIDKQLNNLKTTYIDNYLLHSLSKDKIKKIKDLNLLELVSKWKKEGKIKNIGFSFHDDYETFKEILNMFEWDFCQIQLNYLDTDIQQGMQGYKDLEERKIPVIIMEPIKGGRLASFNEKVSHLITDYSHESLASWALRWCGTLTGVKVILSGMNEKEQLYDNLKTFKNFKPLTEEEMLLSKKVKEELSKIIEVGCTKCEYCMPCPMEVNIPRCFSLFNDFAMYQAVNFYAYKDLLDKGADPSKCIKCGKCEKACPQHIAVPFELQRMRDTFDKHKPK